MSRKALIVDAEPAICEILQEILRPAGIDAITVAKAADAAGRLQTEKFDVVFVDLGPSSVNGIELTRKTRGSGFNRMTPIILFSGDRQRGAFSQGFQAGASFVVHKPVDRARLIKLVRVAQGSMEHERRRFRRVALRARVRLTLGNSQIEGETIDLSLNGTLVRTPRAFSLGSSVQVGLFLPSSPKPVIGQGNIVRIMSGDRMGIQFNAFSLEEGGRLQDFLLPLLIGQDADEVGQARSAARSGA